jgi:hypothetical protein
MGMRRDESHVTKRVMSVNVDGHSGRGRARKRWMDCVKDDMKIKGVSMEMTSVLRYVYRDAVCTPELVYPNSFGSLSAY